ncbi:hypothetical protein BKA93DRAFT_726558 [Sparassis latifolia]|uniref:DUF6593 domain-containing protein n=1 Tax=Sparassis crispa TaxID=139825 RepID=A0A401GKJ6_9APHY|nr:hypothetical protein SCP_0410760 [Sparassis crispa]GBE82691.1 hypothetical protein SCP_0410760 [Sparassis crispa]
MNLYFVPNDPEHTTLVSTNGIAHYQVATTKGSTFGGPAVTVIKRPADSEMDSVVAEVEWRRWGAHPVVRSNVFDGQIQELKVCDFLYKLGSHFSHTRHFLGNDDEEYRWKLVKGIGFVLTDNKTRREVARFTQDVVREGFFRGERKWLLQIQPSTLDIDMIVVTFLIMEKKRRDRVADHMSVANRDEDPGDGGGFDVGIAS